MIKLKGGASEGLNGFMDEGTELQGELRFRDTFRIDGRVKGKIVSDHTLIVGESAHVDAEIDCGVVSIRGTVSGRVQGVFFRESTRRRAQELGLSGWVRNLPDGETVEALFVGTREACEQALAFVKVGPPAADVTGIDFHWEKAPSPPVPGFVVR